MYVIFPADEVVYLSYGRLIYVPTATSQQQGRNEFNEPVPIPAPLPSSAHSTGSYTTCPSPSIPSTSSSNRSFRSTASSPLVNGYGDNYSEKKSKGGKGKEPRIPINKSDTNLSSYQAKPGNSKQLASSNDNVFLKVPSPTKGAKTEKRLSYSDFLPVHKCLKETKPATKKSLKNNPFDFDDLFKRETTPTKGILRSSSQTTSESRLQLSGLQLTPDKSPTKKKTFFSSSPKPEPRIKRTSDFGYATKMAASDTSSLKDLTHPSYNELLKGHNGLTFKLIRTVSDFTQQLSQMYEQHAQELQHLVASFRKRNGELRKERPSCPSTLFHTWETLLQEVEIDSQALGDIASIMGRQVSRPLLEKSFYRKIQSRKVFTHRESYEAIIGKTEEKLVKCRQEYKNAYLLYLSNPTTDTLSEYFNAHNAYVQQLHATNGMLEEYHKETLPQLLQELEEIYIDLCSTLAEAVLQGAEVVSAKAIEQCKRYDGLSAQIKNLNGATDIIHLARALPVPQGRPPILRKVFVPPQPPAPPPEPDGEDGPAHHHHHHIQNENIPPPLKDELVIDRLSALQVKPSHDALKKEAGDLEAQIRQIHDSLETLVKLQHRSVEASLFNKANEIQEDISMKRFDLRVAQIHLSAINSQALAYLSDIFLQINKFNLTLQNNSITIFGASDRIESMMKKVDFWKSCIEKGQPEVFENLYNFLSENKLRLSPIIHQQIVKHLEGLKSAFRKYFPKPDNMNNWILNLFENEYFEVANLSIKEKEALIEFSSDTTLKSQFKTRGLLNFWAAINNEFGLISDKALKFLLPVTSTELVERAFSSYVFIKK